MPAPIAEDVTKTAVSLPTVWRDALKRNAYKRGTNVAIEMRCAIRDYLKSEGVSI